MVTTITCIIKNFVVNIISVVTFLYSAADLFIFPTRNEAFGIVSTESMACGTDVVAFNASGVSDAVRPGITGLLAERENVEQLRDHIVQLLEDEALPLSMSTKCRAIPTLRVLRSRSVPVGAAALFTVRVACPLGT